MKQLLCILLLLAISIGEGYSREPRIKGNDKRVEQSGSDTLAKPRLSPYDKLYSGSSISKGFITLIKKGGSLYIEIPDSLLGRDMLLGARVAAISNNKSIAAGQRRSNPKLFSFKKDKGRLLMIIPVSKNVTLNNDSILPSVERNNIEPVTRIFDIVASKGGNSIIDVTKYFTDEVSEVWPSDLSKSGKLETKLGGIKSHKVYEQNVEIVSDYYYVGAREPFAVSMNYSILLLSKEPMRERYSDSRVGFMNDSKRIYSVDSPVDSRRFISRFRVEPRAEDLDKYKRGELVEPAKQIVFYVDTVMPYKYRVYAREGIEIWNKAFEAIGFKNVIKAYDFPKDPDFSSNDITKNCLHYIATEQENASGPCWNDPRSGEIIQADILWYHSVVNLLQRWRFLQTAAADPRARKLKMDDDVLGELIRYAVSHEVGHCLGLQHNMRGSYAYPVDSLRSPSFTQKYGTTATIMDYARNNHVAQPGDAGRGVRMIPPDLGPFDYLSIEYGYKPIFDVNSAIDELPKLNSIFKGKENDPFYMFAPMTAAVVVPDPSAQSDALSNDLVASGDLAIKNLKYITSNLLEWFNEYGNSQSELSEIVDGIHRQYLRHLTLSASYIGGVYTYNRSSDDLSPRYKVVAKAKQREALQFIFRNLRESSNWVNPSELTAILGNKSASFIKRQNDLIAALLSPNMLSRMVDSSENVSSDLYSVVNYFDDLHSEVFVNISTTRLSSYDKAIQISYIQGIETILSNATKSEKSISPSDMIASSAAMGAKVKAKQRLNSLISQGGSNVGHYTFLLEMMK
ncbi:MAG: zinc-dependent metalloprotease [Bacteroidales bacterium]